MPKTLTVLVTGATGQQGGALARELLNKGHMVRALTRKPDSPAAKALAQAGATVVQGGFDDPASLVRAARGVDTVFAMGTPFEGGTGTETRQGIAVADAAKEAGVGHFVYTSVSDADRKTGVPHFESKYRVEEHLSRLGIPYTVIAPVWFMENFRFPFSGLDLAAGKLVFPMPPSRPLQQISVVDVGRFAALVVERREAFFGKRINLASDARNGAQMVELLSQVLGRKIEYQEIPIEPVRQMNADIALMFEWFNREGFSADIAGLRRDYPEVGWLTFEEWLRRHGLQPGQ